MLYFWQSLRFKPTFKTYLPYLILIFGILRVFEDADYEYELNKKNKNKKLRFQYGRPKFKW